MYANLKKHNKNTTFSKKLFSEICTLILVHFLPLLLFLEHLSSLTVVKDYIIIRDLKVDITMNKHL